MLHPQATARERFRITAAFWGRSLLGLGVAVALAELGKATEVWPGHPLFPSGHTTFAMSAATCIVLQRGKGWLWLLVPIVGLMGVCLVYGQWHTPDEVAGGLVVGSVVPRLLWKLSTLPFVRRTARPVSADLRV
ncbi:MAG: phosphatase PAP2 family protein [Capsulimonadales bacterium]|nr:phosphatase PAP2 family protein [Capsulimonadales bacterium]